MSIENEIAVALEKNDDTAACALMEALFNPNYAINGDPLLFRAAEQPNVPKAVRKLIEKGATVNMTNWRGMSPLIACADRGHNIDVLKTLIKNEADIDYCMGGNRDAFFFAQLSRWNDGVAYLTQVIAQQEAKHEMPQPKKISDQKKPKKSRSAGRDRTI